MTAPREENMTVETELKLPELAYKMVIWKDEMEEHMPPWASNGCLYFCDGRIAIELMEVAPWPGINCRVEQDGKWVIFDTPNLYAKRPPPDVKTVIDEVWVPCKNAVPHIEKPADTDERWKRRGTCDECILGSVECDYGHTHDCPNCDGTGIAEEVDEEAFESIEIDGVKYSKRYIWTISQLPEAKLGKPAYRDKSGAWKAMAFEFNGGRGCLMPMETRQA